MKTSGRPQAWLCSLISSCLITLGASADVVDQENAGGDPTNFQGLIGIQNTVLAQPLWVGQQFSPDLPILTAVEFGILGDGHAWNNMPADEPITVEIRSTTGGVPNALLASSTRMTPLDGPGGQVYSGRFDLPAPLDVSALVGNAASMAILVTLPDPTTAGEWNVLFMDGDYPDGSWLQSTDSGASWQLNGGRDLIFRTYGIGATGGVLSVTNVVVDDVVALEFQSTLGVDYTLEWNTNLVVETWESAGWHVTGDGNAMLMYDATGFDTNKAYRAREVP